MFIVVEGADAVGKNTLTTSLVETFQSLEVEAVKMSFPRYATPVGELILAHLKGEVVLNGPNGIPLSGNDLMFQCLMLADKVDAAAEIMAALDSGKQVICDRYWQSAYVYGSSDGLDKAWLFRTHLLMPKATANILLDLPVEESARRRPEYRDRYEKNRTKMALVAAGYRQLWAEKAKEDPSWHVVDASQTPDEVLRQVLEIVCK